MMLATLRHLVDAGVSIVLTTHYLEEAEALADRVAVLNKDRMIASDSVNEMRALVARKHVVCSTVLTVEEVRRWPEVERAARDHHGLRITARNAEAVVRRLLAVDGDLQDLEIRRAGLAEAFTELTQEAA
jgi:ABC-type multidrug transport system ATPase subunit